MSTSLFPFTARIKVLKTGYFPLAQCHIVFYLKKEKLKVSTTIGYSEVIKRVSFADCSQALFYNCLIQNVTLKHQIASLVTGSFLLYEKPITVKNGC